MKNKNDDADTNALRRRAEEQLAARRERARAGGEGPALETQRLVHELQVHQIELELQNEELQRARAEVEEGLARYTELYEHAPMGCMTLGQDGVIRQLNLTSARLLGMVRARLVGRRLGLLVSAPSRAVLEAFLERVFAGQSREACDLVMSPEGAELNLVELTGAVTEDGTECRVVVTDITERRRVEAGLAVAHTETSRRSNELQALLRAARAVIESRSFEESALRIFDECRAATGATSGYVALLSGDGTENDVLFLEAGGLPCSVDPTLPMPIRGLRALAYRHRAVMVENEFLRSRWCGLLPEGHVPMRNVLFAPLVIAGEAVGVIGLANKATDFTPEDTTVAAALGDLAAIALTRARTEEDLRRSLAEYQTLAEHIPDLLVRFNPELHQVYTNPAAAGFRADPVGGVLAREQWKSEVQAVFATGEALSVEAEVPTPAGLRTLLVQLIPEHAEDGSVRSVLSLARDITQLRRDQQERVRLQASLAQSDRLASVGLLAAGIAHEINNPLAYTLHNVESLAEDLPRLAGAVKRCRAALAERLGGAASEQIGGAEACLLLPATLDDIVQRAQEALDGIHRIRDIALGLSTFSRVEQVQRAQVDPNATLRHAIRMASNEIKYRARLVEDYGPVSPILATEGKLAQVFLNLLINAAQAIEEGDVEGNRVTVRTRTEGGDLVVEFSDTGKGIPAERLDRIFEPFFSTKRTGSGLGLAICRNLVAELGGTILAESEVGEGSRFIVRLPSQTAAREEPQETTAEERPAVEPSRGRVLIVDDEPAILGALRRILGREHDLALAASGAAARDILERDASFDLILCDLMMPQMTGMDLHAWLVGHNPALAARVVFFTGGSFTPKAAEYLASVDNLKIDKPFASASVKKFVAERIRAVKGASA